MVSKMINRKGFLTLVLFVVVLALIVNLNLENIMASRADYYFKHNDIQKAQKYMEKAFDLGLKDIQKRDMYVNSIINSPLDIEAQRKLVKFLKYPVQDGARVRAEYFLYDLKVEVFRKYFNNYIAQAPANNQIIRWTEIPITYGFQMVNNVPEYYIEEIRETIDKLTTVLETTSEEDTLVYSDWW